MFHKNLIQSNLGFTLIELMTVVVIIGILATIGIPSYSEYVYSSKLSEGYINISAITKSQIVLYNEQKYFASGHTESIGGGNWVPVGGSKIQMNIDPSFGDWIALGSPIPDGSFHYMNYSIQSANWDASGAERNGGVWDSSVEPEFKTGPVHTEIDCNSGLTAYDLGLTPANSRSVALISGRASFKMVRCSHIIQTIIADGTDITTSSMITIRE
jgi:prepilin-type N-terminal cleavage/methylation domain-containing protein